MARQHTLDIYAHVSDGPCLGCFDPEAADASAEGDGENSATAESGAPPIAPPARPEETAPLPAEDAPETPLGWIEVELVDAADKPTAGALVEVTLADGSVREGQTDAAGVFRLARIPPGSCQVRFPDLDDRVIEAL
jgi:hypothetical protein